MTSLDPYAFVKDAYFQRQQYQLYDGNPPEQSVDEAAWKSFWSDPICAELACFRWNYTQTGAAFMAAPFHFCSWLRYKHLAISTTSGSHHPTIIIRNRKYHHDLLK